MIQSAMILAAGFGLRMQPLTHTLPKPLISVAGKSMLERAFEHVISLGISRIVVNTHYLAPLIEEKVKVLYPQAFISHEEVLLETGGGIKKALPLLGKKAFLTLNGDNIWNGSQSLHILQTLWDEAKMEALLLLIPRERAHGYEGRGDFLMTCEGRLSRPEKTQEAPYVYSGVQLVHPGLFHHTPHGPFSMNLLWNNALQKGRLYGHIHEGDWFHISTPLDIEKYEHLLI